MFKGRNLVTMLVMVSVAILATYIGTSYYYEHEISKFLGISNELEKSKDAVTSYSGNRKETVNVGVIIPDRLLTGDSEKDWKFAESFFSKEQKLTRSKTGTLSGIPEHTGFSFKCSSSPQ